MRGAGVQPISPLFLSHAPSILGRARALDLLIVTINGLLVLLNLLLVCLVLLLLFLSLHVVAYQSAST